MKKYSKELLALTVIIFSVHVSHAQVLETEDSKPLERGQVEAAAGLELQTSKEGTETAVPFAFEIGVTKKATLLVEPVSFTRINQPKLNNKTSGIGDLEISLFYQIILETKTRPSISIAAEVKLPTARDTLIGTQKTDFTPYLIASKTMGKFFTSVNMSYTFLGKPPGVTATNLFNYAIGTIYSASPKNILFAELYGNTSASGKDVPEGSIISSGKNSQELSGGEIVGSIGYGFYASHQLLLSFGISYDNNHAVLFRPGIQFSFGSANKVIP